MRGLWSDVKRKRLPGLDQTLSNGLCVIKNKIGSGANHLAENIPAFHKQAFVPGFLFYRFTNRPFFSLFLISDHKKKTIHACKVRQPLVTPESLTKCVHTGCVGRIAFLVWACVSFLTAQRNCRPLLELWLDSLLPLIPWAGGCLF